MVQLHSGTDVLAAVRVSAAYHGLLDQLPFMSYNYIRIFKIFVDLPKILVFSVFLLSLPYYLPFHLKVGIISRKCISGENDPKIIKDSPSLFACPLAPHTCALQKLLCLVLFSAVRNKTSFLLPGNITESGDSLVLPFTAYVTLSKARSFFILDFLILKMAKLVAHACNPCTFQSRGRRT